MPDCKDHLDRRAADTPILLPELVVMHTLHLLALQCKLQKEEEQVVRALSWLDWQLSNLIGK